MPIYEYQCPDCGPFSAWRSMAASAGPAACPTCQLPAERILSATQIGARRSGRRRGGPEPRLVQKSADAPPSAQPAHTHAHGRPWMFGH